jgi:DNA-directed RNA polymerase subunit alpha
VEAAKILRKHLNPFVQYYEPGPGLPSDGGADGYRRARWTPSSSASST